MHLINSILAAALFCTPIWTESGSIQVDEVNLATVTGSPCFSHRSDLSVGKLIYFKGQATLNGAEPQAGAHLHNGDILNTSVDGFVAVELNNGTRLSIQPATHFSVVCAVNASNSDEHRSPVEMNIPHLSGAVRG